MINYFKLFPKNFGQTIKYRAYANKVSFKIIDIVNGKTWRKLVFVLISKNCECYAEKDGAQLVVLVKDNAVNA